ncbi:S8 family serine peptidase [Candidatus Saccharibacteria bacterium]|jgi:hypothetical protein|nr:S8 family serine peptidase [Candidatus Saccharibacteria bacterium]
MKNKTSRLKIASVVGVTSLSAIILSIPIMMWLAINPLTPAPIDLTTEKPEKIVVVQEKISPESTQKQLSSIKTGSNPQKNLASENNEIKQKPNQPKIVNLESNEKFPLRIYKPLSAPNDPNANQWWFGKIGLDKTWNTPAGDYQTTLAIIDTGFALNHEEFSDRFYQNSGEIGLAADQNPSQLNCSDQGIPLDQSCNNIDDNSDGITDNESGGVEYENRSFLNCSDRGIPLEKSCNLIDDDDNGFADDVSGWDFISGDKSPQAGETNPSGTGTKHGSYVAGAAAANNNNGKGIAGVDNHTKILPIQALDDNSFGHTISVARSVRYAAAMSADVISLSLGTQYNDPYLREAIYDAHAAGSIVIAASGNDGCNCINYPANFPEVLAVGASSPSDQPYSFSNYGTNLDIIAPGAGFHVPTWNNNDQTAAYADDIAGTSLSTPLVAGSLSKLKSYMPNATNVELIGLLTEQSNHLSLSANQPRTNNLGFGRLDVFSAYSRTQSPFDFPLIYGFSGVSSGGKTGAQPEPVGHQTTVHDCRAQNKIGTTPVWYIDANPDYFTSSQAEWERERDSGKSSRLLGYSCLVLPGETIGSFRQIDPIKEFIKPN